MTPCRVVYIDANDSEVLPVISLKETRNVFFKYHFVDLVIISKLATRVLILLFLTGRTLVGVYIVF